jgi:hypothetical protein
MAESSQVEMKAHERTYGSFLRLLKYGALLSFLVAFIVVILISS